MVKVKRFLTVTSIALTLFSFGIGYLCLRTFTLMAWIILSLQIELGILIFALSVIGIIIGYGWASDGDEDESFIDYTKGVLETFED
jgi:hypothetical protein